jgi:hypothetical protein
MQFEAAPPTYPSTPAAAHWPPMVRAIVATFLFAVINGGCGARVTAPIFEPRPPELGLHWESIDNSAQCKGRVTNLGGTTAHDVSVFFRYSTPQGDTVLAFHATRDVAPDARPGAGVLIYASSQITRGEPRFPDLAGFSYAGVNHVGGWGEGMLPQPGYFSYPCLLSPDSARVWIRNQSYGLAHHVVLNIETTTGVAQIPLRDNPLGPTCGTSCANGGTQDCDGWGTLHLGVRDSAGTKLLPRPISMYWENSAGVVDSLVYPNPYYWYGFEEYGLSANCSP